MKSSRLCANPLAVMLGALLIAPAVGCSRDDGSMTAEPTVDASDSAAASSFEDAPSSRRDTERTEEEIDADTSCETARRDAQPVQPIRQTDACEPGEFHYVGEICGPTPSPDAGTECQSMGDGKCYERCDCDSDCTDPARPHCSTLGLFKGFDVKCGPGRRVKVCRSTDQNDCAWFDEK